MDTRGTCEKMAGRKIKSMTLHPIQSNFSVHSYWGLLYWAVVLVISSIPTSMVLGSKSEKLSVVIRRKWFHFLAVVLFGPTTYILPQLLSLSYAIALCVLVVAENLRPDIPFLQSFYLNFVDPAKDNPALIVSHMFLILGCAGPLWIAEWVFDDSLQYPLLSQWGVLCLGVGDAAGAVVGSFFGRHRWGQNRRTIEGSFAMWISVMGIGIVAFSDENWHALAVAATVTTLMEAFTLQMDNLVLPLVGATMILLQS
jgi:dolichol kinase